MTSRFTDLLVTVFTDGFFAVATLFRDVLGISRNIINGSHNIRSRAGFLTAQFAAAMTTSALAYNLTRKSEETEFFCAY